MAHESPPALRVWITTLRPKTLPAAAAPVAMGAALAAQQGAFHAPSALCALLFALLIQIGTNFANDYFDARQGADTDARKGPRRALQLGVVTPAGMWRATLLVFALAALASLYLLYRAGWALAVVAVLSIACGFAYTAGKRSLAYLGIADLFVVVFFGPVAVAGTFLAQTRSFSLVPVVAGLTPGLIATGLLVINNLRDVAEDAVAGKRTLAVRFGPRFARLEYTVLHALAAVIPAILAARGALPAGAALASLSILPAIPVIRRVWTTQGAALNPLLGATARLLLLHVGLFCLGVFL